MFDPNTILTDLQRLLPEFDFGSEGDERVIWIGYSGGLDSSALLHAVANLPLHHKVKAIHVNHQISKNAESWQQHCKLFADRLNVELVVERVDVVNQGKGIEEAARELRYTMYQRHLNEGDILLLGHHLNDQVETLLYRLMRGAGLRGMAGMPVIRGLPVESRQKSVLFIDGSQDESTQTAKLLRPLLNVSRSELRQYAQRNNLSWIDDESNEDNRYDRNYLRNQVIPTIQSRWPDFIRKWRDSINWLAEANTLLDEYTREDLQRLECRTERLGESLALSSLKNLSSIRQKQVIRYWVRQNGYNAPENAHLSQLTIFFDANHDQQPELVWGDCELRRFQGRLYLLPALPPFDATFVDIRHSMTSGEYSRIVLPDGAWLSLPSKWLGNLSLALTVSFRQGGERCQPLSRPRSQTLKKLFQEYQLEPWLRERVPLISLKGQLVAVGDLFMCVNSTDEQCDLQQIGWGYPRRPTHSMVLK